MEVSLSNNAPYNFEFDIFNPNDIALGQLWSNPPADNNTTTAASFTASNSESLSSSSANFDKADVDFSFGGWAYVNLAVVSGSRMFISKFGGAGQRSYALVFNPITLRFEVFGSTDGTAITSLAWSAVSIKDNFYHVVGVHDSVNNLLKLSVNGGTFVTIPFAGGPASSTDDFRLGTNSSAPTTNGHDGRLDDFFFYDKALSQAEVTALYNGGLGVAYEDLSAGQLTSLVSWWDLNEMSGVREDSHGSNDLTDNNTVLVNAGAVINPAESGDSISLALDQFPSLNHITAAAFAERPILLNGVHVFDGISNFFGINPTMADIGSSTQGLISLWIRVPSGAAVGDIILNFGALNSNYEIQLIRRTGGALRWQQRAVASRFVDIITDNQVIFDNTWHHISIRQDGTGPVIRVDNVAVPQTDTCNVCQPSFWFNDIPQLDVGRIGCRDINGAGPVGFFTGEIQQVHIYNSPGTLTELTKLYNFNQP